MFAPSWRTLKLAKRRRTWQGDAVPAHRPSAAGGFLIAIGATGGAIVGFIVRQPTIWFLAGTAAGIVAALLIWWRTSRR